VSFNPTIATITTNTGETASLLRSGVTCIVGGNNVGKSQLLRDLVALLEIRPSKPVVVTSLQLDTGDLEPEDELEAWLNRTADKTEVAGQAPTFTPIPAGGQALNVSGFISNVSQPNFLGQARPFYCWYADAGNRANLGAGSVGAPNMRGSAHPLIRVYRDGDLEEALSLLSESLFGFPLTLDRVNGNVLFRVGNTGLTVPPLDHPTLEYSDAVAALPELQSQGDGVKSFIGLALHVKAGHQPMILIDEPEAFLHQSQSKALGRWLAKESVAAERQVILATHDRDIVLGLLSGDAPVTVLRLTREGNDSHLDQLKAEDLATVWDDAILRYSNVLDGLFYGCVVVCEGDADCRFYSAVLDDLASGGATSARPDDVLMVPSGGKGRVANIANALKALKVRLFAIVDFDALRERTVIKQIVESVGGEWDSLEEDYSSLIRVMNPNGGVLWDQAKTQGLAAVPQGDASQQAVRLLGGLSRQRVLVVPVGEMEGFDRTIGGKSSTWVNGMLAKNGHKLSSEARDLVAHIS